MKYVIKKNIINHKIKYLNYIAKKLQKIKSTALFDK